jgi:hypothetical protein
VHSGRPTAPTIGDELSAAYTTTAKLVRIALLGGPPSTFAGEIAKIRYPGLDLSHLRGHGNNHGDRRRGAHFEVDAGSSVARANGGNPWDIPGWNALHREASLVRYLVGSGATALGKANYADQTGEYYTVFFGLSVGLERLAKLILVTDHAFLNKGELPQQSVVSQFGHACLTGSTP